MAQPSALGAGVPRRPVAVLCLCRLRQDSVLGWVSVGNGLSGHQCQLEQSARPGTPLRGRLQQCSPIGGVALADACKDSAALTLTNPAVILSGGNLPEPLTNAVTLQNFLTYAGTNLTLSVPCSNGSLSGWFHQPGGRQADRRFGRCFAERWSRARFFPRHQCSSGACCWKASKADATEAREEN